MTKAETIHTTEPQMLTIWPFKKEFANSHFYTVQVLCFFINIPWRSFRIIHWIYFILLGGIFFQNVPIPHAPRWMLSEIWLSVYNTSRLSPYSSPSKTMSPLKTETLSVYLSGPRVEPNKSINWLITIHLALHVKLKQTLKTLQNLNVVQTKGFELQ